MWEQLLNKTFLGAFHCQTKTLWPPQGQTISLVSVELFLSVFLDANEISQYVIRIILFIVMVSSRLHQSSFLVCPSEKNISFDKAKVETPWVEQTKIPSCSNLDACVSHTLFIRIWGKVSICMWWYRMLLNFAQLIL